MLTSTNALDAVRAPTPLRQEGSFRWLHADHLDSRLLRLQERAYACTCEYDESSTQKFNMVVIYRGLQSM